jgi:hypothetical protein
MGPGEDRIVFTGPATRYLGGLPGCPRPVSNSLWITRDGLGIGYRRATEAVIRWSDVSSVSLHDTQADLDRTGAAITMGLLALLIPSKEDAVVINVEMHSGSRALYLASPAHADSLASQLAELLDGTNVAIIDDDTAVASSGPRIEEAANDSLTSHFPPQLQVRLLIVGDPMDHPSVTDTVGLEPTSTHVAGQPIGNGRMKAKVSTWVHSLPAVEGYAARTQVAALFEKLAGREDAIHGLQASGMEIEVRVVVVLGVDGLPDLGLDRELIERMAHIGAHLDVDIYEHGHRDLLNQRHPM